MKVVIAIDSFKGSLSSLEAGRAIEKGILKAAPNTEVCIRPLADGGEGTVEALALGMGGHIETIAVTGPLREPVQASYGIVPKRNLAIIEMAAAAGITLVPPDKRNPLHTTTYGVGELIRDAIGKGCREFIVGIGGSATNDGGFGMLQALGYEFYDGWGHPVASRGESLKEITRIDDANVIPELKECTFHVACDVTNPLCGENGCSAIYGPQKGATPEIVKDMDEWLKQYAKLTRSINSEADPDTPGAGAAGGLGFAFLAYTNATLQSGVQVVLEGTNLKDHVKDADLVITGEGRLDGQTVMGKAPIGVAALAKKYGKTVIAFSGCVTEDATMVNEHGIDAFFPILRSVVSPEEAMDSQNAANNLTATTEQVFRLLQIARQ